MVPSRTCPALESVYLLQTSIQAVCMEFKLNPEQLYNNRSMLSDSLYGVDRSKGFRTYQPVRCHGLNSG